MLECHSEINIVFYSVQKSCYLVRLDPPLPRWQNLGLPFQWVTWITIVTALALTGPALFLLARASTGSRWEGERVKEGG